MSEQEPTANSLHDEAMNISEEAQTLYRKALRLEKLAISRTGLLENREPTYSILCSSAAWLAVKADLPHSAIEIVDNALANGKPNGYTRGQLESARRWAEMMLKERGE